MNLADIKEGVTEQPCRVVLGIDFLEAKKTKKGVEISVGIAGNENLINDLVLGKRQALLVVIDRKEYEKFNQKVNN